MDHLSRLAAKIARAAERAQAEKPKAPDTAAFMLGDHLFDGTVMTRLADDPEPEPEPTVNSLTMAEALAVVRNKLLADKALAYSWHCNLKGMLIAAFREHSDRMTSNDEVAADCVERIMGSLFDVHGAGTAPHMLAEESCERAKGPTNWNNLRREYLARNLAQPWSAGQGSTFASMAALRQQQERDKNARMAQMAAVIGNPMFASVGRSILQEHGITPKPILSGAWNAIGDDDTLPSESNPR